MLLFFFLIDRRDDEQVLYNHTDPLFQYPYHLRSSFIIQQSVLIASVADTNLTSMAPLLVMRRRHLLVPRRPLLSLPSTRPQIQRAHNLPAIVFLVHLGLDISLTASTLLGMQDSPVPVVGSKEELRTNVARVPGMRRIADLANETTKDASGVVFFTCQLRQVLVIVVAGVGLANDSGVEVASVEFLARSQFARWRRRG